MCIFFRGGSHARLLGARRETPIEKKVACEAERAHLAAHRSAPPGAGGAGASVGRMPKESLTELLMFADQIKKNNLVPQAIFFWLSNYFRNRVGTYKLCSIAPFVISQHAQML